jgi:hypothetical protein
LLTVTVNAALPREATGATTTATVIAPVAPRVSVATNVNVTVPS